MNKYKIYFFKLDKIPTLTMTSGLLSKILNNFSLLYLHQVDSL